jgi:hypothetical protein
MTGFDLSINYHLGLESLLRKSCSRLSSSGSSGSRVREIVEQFQGSTPQVEPVPMAAQKCINDFLAPSSTNIRTSPGTNVRDGNFELKSALIDDGLLYLGLVLLLGTCVGTRELLPTPLRDAH